MKKAFHLTHKHIVSPVKTAGSYMMAINRQLLNGKFEEVWVNVPVDQKLSWLLFAGNTIAILTALEFLLLHK